MINKNYTYKIKIIIMSRILKNNKFQPRTKRNKIKFYVQ